MLAKRHLLQALIFGILAATAIGLALGLLTPAQLLHIDAERFSARGLIIEGLERGVGVSVFTFFLMGLVAGIEATGMLDRVVAYAKRAARSTRGAELEPDRNDIAQIQTGSIIEKIGEANTDGFHLIMPTAASLIGLFKSSSKCADTDGTAYAA